MASQYYALSKILHGQGAAGELVFEVGDQVKGLNKDAMISLWNAGVLTERDPNQAPPDDRDDRIKALEKELADLKASQTAPILPEGESPAAEAADDPAAEPVA